VTSGLIDRLRDSIIPAAEHGTTLDVYVGGVPAHPPGDPQPALTSISIGIERMLRSLV
jgi:hypothetical protein